MKILEETEMQLERKDILARFPIVRPPAAPRTPGIHASGILRYVAETSGMKKVLEQISEDDLPLRWAMGFAWEEFCASFYPDMVYQPGEASPHNIVMTCDGHSYIDEIGFVIEEFKYTAKKRKDAPTFCLEEWLWLQQGKGYCWGYGASNVRWHVCYYNGDYKGAGPVYMRYLIHFNEEDLAATSRMLLANRERAIEKGFSE